MGPRRVSEAREVRQAIVWRSRKVQGFYGSAQTNDSPASVPRLTFPPSPKGLLLGFHAHQPLRCATKMNNVNESLGVKSTAQCRCILSERIVTNWRRRSSGLRRGLEGDTRLVARMNRKTFSESFSKRVRNGSSEQSPSYLILFEKSHIFASKTGHEPPDSDLRLQIVTG